MLDIRISVPRPSVKLLLPTASTRHVSTDSLEAIRMLPRRPTARAVPWDWPELSRVLLFTVARTSVTGLGLVLVRLAVQLFAVLAVRIGVLGQATFQSMSSGLTRYEVPCLLLTLIAVFYVSLALSVYRCAVGRAGARPVLLGIRALPIATLGRVLALYVPIALLGMVVTAGQASLLGVSARGSGSDMVNSAMIGSTPALVVVAILFVLVVPVCEELFFRAFLLGLLRNWLPSWAAIGGSALVYAASHGSLALLPWLFFMGIAYGVVVTRTGSVYAGVALHIVTNTVGMIALIAATYGW